MKVVRFAISSSRLIGCLVLAWIGTFTPFILLQILTSFAQSPAMFALMVLLTLAAGINWWQRGGLAFSRA